MGCFYNQGWMRLCEEKVTKSQPNWVKQEKGDLLGNLLSTIEKMM